MDRTQLLFLASLVVTAFGLVITVGSLLDSLGVQTGIDSEDLIIGAGITVAGAGAAVSFRQQLRDSNSQD